MKKMSPTSRIITGVASLCLIATYFLPVWFIFLLAPQYPEGLTMQIWLNKITGEVDIINGLNHYIGMKHISSDMFPEFDFLVYVVGFYVLFGLLVAVTGNRKLLVSFLFLTVIGAAAAMYDFYRWGYDYGHNLDPTAAIQVPGLTYQPPLIGHKTLLNFDAYSYPDIGGWVVIGVAITFFGVWFFEWKKNRKQKKHNRRPIKGNMAKPIAAVSLLSLFSCSVKPEPIAYGKDICNECNMTIMEAKFAGEVITKKGKVFKFDDVHCQVRFLKSGKVQETDIAQSVFINYMNEEEFLNVNTSVFVHSEKLKSPMNGNIAAFASRETAEKKAQETGGQALEWKTIIETQ